MKKENVSATVSKKAKELRDKIKENGINFSFHVERLIFELAKKNKIK